MPWKAQFEHLIDAMVTAEGGESAFIRAVQCSIPHCSTYEEARHIAAATITHALWDLAVDHDPTAFIGFLGSRWAPIGASNDPHGLNKNWVPNVIKAYGR